MEGMGRDGLSNRPASTVLGGHGMAILIHSAILVDLDVDQSMGGDDGGSFHDQGGQVTFTPRPHTK